METDPVNWEKTTFALTNGLWQVIVMPVVIVTCHRLLKNCWRAVEGLSWKTCQGYKDDIIVMWGGRFDEYLKDSQKVFRKLRETNLVLIPKKCHHFRTKVRKHLDYVVSREGLAVDPERDIS